MRSALSAIIFILGCEGGDGGQDATDGIADREEDAGAALMVEAGPDFIAARAGGCLEFGPEEFLGVSYIWEIIEAPEGSVGAALFNAGKESRSIGCDCSCPVGANARAQTCFGADRPGIYILRLAATRGDEVVEDELRVLVPPVLEVRLAWFPEVDLNLHVRQAGAAWESEGDASWHNFTIGVPDWGAPRGAPGETCDPVELCACDRGPILGWCLRAEGGNYRCTEVPDDPIYLFNDFSGTFGGEEVTLARPATGIYEIGVENRGEEPWEAMLRVRWRGEIWYDGMVGIPPTAGSDVTSVLRITVPTGEEDWWEDASWEEL